MDTPAPAPRASRTWLLAAIFFVVAFDVAFLWQRHAGAFQSEFGGTREEAGHYLYGLMVRDYLAAGLSGSPARFAEKFGQHYPSEALHGPPSLFGMVEGIWMLIFGTSRTAVLLLQTTLEATFATMFAWACSGKSITGKLRGALIALLFVSLSPVRASTASLDPRLLGTVLILAGLLLLFRGLRRAAKPFEPSVGVPVSSGTPDLLVLAIAGMAWACSAIFLAPHRKDWSGFGALAEMVAQMEPTPKGAVLVCSDHLGEGMFIAELARDEKRPGHIVERASRVLTATKFRDAGALTEFLMTGEIRHVVLDDTLPEDERQPHHDLLARVVRENAESFREVARAAVTRDGVLQEVPARLYLITPRRP